jgi:hypothetical protein
MSTDNDQEQILVAGDDDAGLPDLPEVTTGLPEELALMNGESETDPENTDVEPATGVTPVADPEGENTDPAETVDDNPNPGLPVDAPADDLPQVNDFETSQLKLSELTSSQDLLVEKQNDLLAQHKDLADKYQLGEIDEAQYSHQKLVIERDLRKTDREVEKLDSELSGLQARQNAFIADYESRMATAVTSFLNQPENSVFQQGTPAFLVLDQQVRILQATLPSTTPPDVLMQKARAATAAIVDIPPVPAGKLNVPASTQKPPARTPPNVPPNLSQIPAVVSNNTDGEFAHLESLKGVSFDRAFAKMSAAQQERYLAGG